MTRTNYTAEFKAKLVLETIRGERELNEIAAENSINPNMLRNQKKEFLDNAGRAFDESKQNREARRKEEALKKENERLLKTIGQLTLEHDFFRTAFASLEGQFPRCQIRYHIHKMRHGHMHLTAVID